MSKKKKRRREKMEDNDNGLLWRIVKDHPDIFDTHIVTKLNGNDVKFFYDVNSESRAAIKRSGAKLPNAFKIGDFDTKSTVSWALEKCSENRERFYWRMAENGEWRIELVEVLRCKGCSENMKAQFCEQMARNGNLELLQVLRGKGCPWNEWTCSYAAKNGHFECLKYLHENGCPWDYRTCDNAVKYNEWYDNLECFKYAHENGCPGSSSHSYLLY